MFDTLSAQIGAVFMVVVCGFAFLKGDEPERIAAGAFVLAWFASLLAQDDSNRYSVQWGVFAIDMVMLVVLGALAWKSRRTWPVWAAACQLMVVTSHIMSLVDLRPSVIAVLTVINLAGYGVLVALTVGTFWAWQDRRAAGIE
jgi:hypothetical protein